jgi:hypothetical protein
MRTLFVLLAVVNMVMLLTTGIMWFALGAMGFVVGAAALAWLQATQDRIVREMSKTCLCPLCVANRDKDPKP